jgi:hypothetical protein
MWIHRPIGFLAAALIVAGAATPVADAFDAAWIGGGIPPVPPAPRYSLVSAHPRPAAGGVPEAVWQEINDAVMTKLLNRS